MRFTAALLSATLMIVLFQNFISFDIAFDPKYKVEDSIRRHHAKELLGKHFKGSPAAEETNETLVSIEVFNISQKYTPKKHKAKAEKIAKAILEESNKYNIDPIFVASIIKTESRFNPHARGTSGEIGLMQLMPDTAKYIAQRIKMKNFKGERTLKDPVKNIQLGVAYLDYLRQKFGNRAFAYVPAYNMGPGNVKKLMNRKERPKIYSSKVIGHYNAFYKQINVNEMLKNPYLAQEAVKN